MKSQKTNNTETIVSILNSRLLSSIELTGIINNYSPKSELIELLLLESQNKNKKVSFGASRMLEYLVYQNYSEFIPYIGAFLGQMQHIINPSVMRHFTKIIMLLQKHLLLTGLSEEEELKLIDKHFEWLSHPEIPVAVKANAMDVLYHFATSKTYISDHTWLGEELKLQIEFLLEEGTASIQSRGKRILRKL